mmetsp:Transcript_9285/g.26026  ORF Transcript_9285/g.26026 Transcript_9285/m.26026 type:complete len:279 (-) Transcript_9285:103-939(-)
MDLLAGEVAKGEVEPGLRYGDVVQRPVLHLAHVTPDVVKQDEAVVLRRWYARADDAQLRQEEVPRVGLHPALVDELVDAQGLLREERGLELVHEVVQHDGLLVVLVLAQDELEVLPGLEGGEALRQPVQRRGEEVHPGRQRHLVTADERVAQTRLFRVEEAEGAHEVRLGRDEVLAVLRRHLAALAAEVGQTVGGDERIGDPAGHGAEAGDDPVVALLGEEGIAPHDGHLYVQPRQQLPDGSDLVEPVAARLLGLRRDLVCIAHDEELLHRLLHFAKG